MESSGSDDEEDRVSVRRRDQIDRKAREDDYYRFVSDLSDEDYILMRDNNLLGPPGESTEEELMRRLQLMKENLPQNSDENPDRGDANVTSEQKEIPSWKEESPISANSDELRFDLERNLDPDDKNSNPENECVASAKLPRREDTEDSQRQVESPQSESLFTRPSTPEQDMTQTLMEVPPTRSQRRLRSRSPVYRRTRARTDSSSPPRSLWEIFPSINEDIPSQTFKQPLISENERFSRTGHEESLRQQMPGHELQNRDLIKTSKTRNAVHEECDSDTTCSSESWEVMERNPTTPFNLEVGQVHYQACSQRDSRVSRTQLTSDSPNNTTTSEIEQEELTPMFSHSDEANESASVNTIRNPVHRILNTSLSDTTSVPTQSTLWQTMTGFSNSSNLMHSDSNLEHSVSPPSENIERAESPNERHGPSGSESRPGSASNARYDPDSSLIVISDSSPCSISSSASSSSLIVISDSSPYSISSSAPSPILISSSAPSPILISSSAPSPILISSSAPSPILISSSAPSPILISSSNDEDSETSSLILVESEERSLSTGLSEAGQEGGRMTPIIIDDSDSGSSLNLDEVILLTEADPPQTTGLTTTQIDNLPLRYFGENEEFKACSICITEYTKGNTLRILPCSHEFHDHCIDHWLAEHITCPICRGPVVDPPEADNSM